MIFKILICILFISVKCENCSDSSIKILCIIQETCRDCIEVDPCCNWCYDQNYNGRRCNVIENLKTCDQQQIETNQDVQSRATRKDPFSEHLKTRGGSIQMSPQAFDVFLRKGKPVNISFTYKQAADYPLDLYYLGDLSLSMRDNLKIFKKIGEDLSNRLNSLTKNFKLAYGSFMDKPGMPFYFSVDALKKQPCPGCEEGYLLKHRLSFTKDVNLFTDMVSKSKITANIDDLDGALDAILQILVCPDIVGWGSESRKVILLATDSLLHTAGDGLLVGAVARPTDECMLNEYGEHKDPLKYDYPSVADIHRLLRAKKVNIIFAVKDAMKLEYYRNLTNNLLEDSAFTGKLEDQSDNILQLISEGYENFARQVSFSVNTSYADHIEVKFYGRCPKENDFNETSRCYNVGREPIEFKVQLTLKDYTERQGTVLEDVLFIEEKNINENITLNIRYSKGCGCQHYKGAQKLCPEDQGELECGICYCKSGWTGENCDVSCSATEIESRMQCRSDNGTICSGNGDCDCGKCVCNTPYRGNYCQYRCPSDSHNNICSKNGDCVEGNCVCYSDYEGEDCSCSKLTTNCRFSKVQEVCSSKGKCVCNGCKCQEGYSGRYCEMNKDNNNTLCDEYKEHVEKKTQDGVDLDENVNVTVVQKLSDTEFACQTVAFAGVSRCFINYNYRNRPGSRDGQVFIEAKQECIYTASVWGGMFAVLAFGATLLAGLLTLTFYKVNLKRKEKAEYRRFQEELKNRGVQMNPLYKDPVRVYNNPLRNT